MRMENNGNNPRSSGNGKTMIIVAIVVTLLITISFIYLYLNAQNIPITVNELFDNQLDRNNDEKINLEDLPYDWASYGLGDKIVIRDRIKAISWDSDNNQTTLLLVSYSGKYEGGGGIVSVHIPGNAYDSYSIGDFIIVEGRMVDYGNDNIFPGDWGLITE